VVLQHPRGSSKKGVIFVDTDTALREYPSWRAALRDDHSAHDNKFAA
jgi:Fe-S cluster assembly scaffold protein SufB